MRSRHLAPCLAAPILALSLAACGDDDGKSFEQDGVYSITAWTENPDSCDAEGASVLADHTDTPFLVVQQVTQTFVFDITTITAATCSDPQNCANVANGGAFGSAFGQSWSFDPATQVDGGWESQSATSGSDADAVEMCEGTVTRSRLTVDENDVARVEVRRYENVMWAPTYDEDFEMNTCIFFDDNRIEEAAAGATCSSLEVITADAPQDVPPPEEM